MCPRTTVSSFYVETDDPNTNDAVAAAIEKAVPDVDARSMNEFSANFGALMGQVDMFLMMTVSLALLVGVVGIINTMLMSTTERFIEFGVLRTQRLVAGEHPDPGDARERLPRPALGSRRLRAGDAPGGASANQFISGRSATDAPPWLFALGIGLSLVTGTLGGLYPAWRAARLVPMDAIRLGSH